MSELNNSQSDHQPQLATLPASGYLPENDPKGARLYRLDIHREQTAHYYIPPSKANPEPRASALTAWMTNTKKNTAMLLEIKADRAADDNDAEDLHNWGPRSLSGRVGREPGIISASTPGIPGDYGDTSKDALGYLREDSISRKVRGIADHIYSDDKPEPGGDQPEPPTYDRALPVPRVFATRSNRSASSKQSAHFALKRLLEVLSRSNKSSSRLAQDLRDFIHSGEELRAVDAGLLLRDIAQRKRVDSVEAEGLWIAMLFSKVNRQDHESLRLELARLLVELVEEASPELEARVSSLAVALAQLSEFFRPDPASDEVLLGLIRPLLEEEAMLEGSAAVSRADAIAALGLAMADARRVKVALRKLIDEDVLPREVRRNRLVLHLLV